VTIFVDTSVFYAALDRGDVGHERATAVLGTGEPLVTTDHVLVETWLLAQRRLGQPTADAFWGGARAVDIDLATVEAADLDSAWQIGDAFPDQAFSIVDRTSFAVMLRLGVHRAASFDKDFAVFRFGARRERAFEIVR
jgi:predicted nucleic acid-binding protein